jgi:hypothetical protein
MDLLYSSYSQIVFCDWNLSSVFYAGNMSKLDLSLTLGPIVTFAPTDGIVVIIGRWHNESSSHACLDSCASKYIMIVNGLYYGGNMIQRHSPWFIIPYRIGGIILW